jgi:hypothetical protein
VSRPPVIAAFLVAVGLALEGCGGEKPPAPPAGAGLPAGDALPVEAFVRQQFVHGLGYPAAAAYGPDAVPRLLAMLADPAEQAHWTNVVVVLCAVGDGGVAQAVIDFVHAGEGEIAEAHYDAKGAAVMALGWLLARTGSPVALAYLAGSSEPHRWKGGRIAWTVPGETPEGVRDLLARMAIQGLGLSGVPRARGPLEELREPGLTEDAGRWRSQVRPLVEQSLATHAQVAAHGLRAHYEAAHR